VQLAVELNGVSFAYPGGPDVLSGVDVEIRRGEFVTIAGPNGGGKTTLLRVAPDLDVDAAQDIGPARVGERDAVELDG
jgi:ABC-type Mn2+/Zn2+ transport system ATPase subunit